MGQAYRAAARRSPATAVVTCSGAARASGAASRGNAVTRHKTEE